MEEDEFDLEDEEIPLPPPDEEEDYKWIKYFIGPEEARLHTKEWIDIHRAVSTRRAYISGLRAYLSYLGFYRPGADIFQVADEYAERVRRGKRRYVRDVESFLKNVGYSPKTKSLYYHVIVSYLVFVIGLREIDKLNSTMFRAALPPRIEPLTIDKALDRETIKAILDRCPFDKKALFLTMAEGGLRIGEALNLSIDDVVFPWRDDDEEDEQFWSYVPAVAMLKVRTSKTGAPRVTFVPETTARLLKFMIEEGRGRKTMLFDFKRGAAFKSWSKCLREASLLEKDKITKRATITPHSLRKFFISKLKLVIPDIVVETLAGHRSYLSDSYHRLSTRELLEYYMKGMEAVQIYFDPHTDEEWLKFPQYFLPKKCRDDIKKTGSYKKWLTEPPPRD